MSEEVNLKWDWAYSKVHPAIRYPSEWVEDVDDSDIEKVIAMIDSFNPRTVTPKDVINSLNDYNQGMVSKPPEYYFDITTKPYGEGYDKLLKCMNGDRYFDIVLAPISNWKSPDETKEIGQPDSAWGPQYEVYIGCKITNENSRYSMGVNPTSTFSCRALRFVLGEGQDAKEFGNGYQGRSMTASTLGLDS